MALSEQLETNRRGPAMVSATPAFRRVSRSWHQPQGRRTGASTPAAIARDKPQACELGQRVDRWSFSRIQIGGNLPLPQLRVRAVTGCDSPFIHLDHSGSNRLVVHSLTGQQFSKYLAGSVHLSKPSKMSSSDGFKTIGKAFVDGRISFGGQQIVFPR